MVWRLAILLMFCVTAAWAQDKPPVVAPAPPQQPQAYVPIILDQAAVGELLRWADDELPGSSVRKLVMWLNMREFELKQQRQAAQDGKK